MRAPEVCAREGGEGRGTSKQQQQSLPELSHGGQRPDLPSSSSHWSSAQLGNSTVRVHVHASAWINVANCLPAKMSLLTGQIDGQRC